MLMKLQNLLSRKFLVAIAGIVSGAVLIINGETGAGITAICTAIVSYMVAEGYIDAKAVQAINEVVSDVANEVIKDAE